MIYTIDYVNCIIFSFGATPPNGVIPFITVATLSGREEWRLYIRFVSPSRYDAHGIHFQDFTQKIHVKERHLNKVLNVYMWVPIYIYILYSLYVCMCIYLRLYILDVYLLLFVYFGPRVFTVYLSQCIIWVIRRIIDDLYNLYTTQ